MSDGELQRSALSVSTQAQSGRNLNPAAAFLLQNCHRIVFAADKFGRTRLDLSAVFRSTLLFRIKPKGQGSQGTLNVRQTLLVIVYRCLSQSKSSSAHFSYTSGRLRGMCARAYIPHQAQHQRIYANIPTYSLSDRKEVASAICCGYG
jgi:hypothetical protein